MDESLYKIIWQPRNHGSYGSVARERIGKKSNTQHIHAQWSQSALFYFCLSVCRLNKHGWDKWKSECGKDEKEQMRQEQKGQNTCFKELISSLALRLYVFTKPRLQSMHILQSQPNPAGQGLGKLLHERYRLSVSLQVYKLFCLFSSFIQTWEHSSQFDFYYWQVSILQSHLLCLACLTHSADSVLRAGWHKGLVHACISYQWLKCIKQHFLGMRNVRVPKCQEEVWRQHF